MIQSFFSYDGKFFGVLTKVGEIIIANLLLLLCCVPVVTASGAAASFYYVMIKCVRMERGSLLREFFDSMKRTLAKGVLMSLLLLVWCAVLMYGRGGAKEAAGAELTFPVLFYDVLLGITGMTAIYLFPVFSRFELRIGRMIKLAFVMSIRYFHYTVLITASAAALGWLLFYKLPMASILVVPGVWCFGVTFLMETALHRYTPKPAPGEERWYDETLDWKDSVRRRRAERGKR